MHQTQMKFKRVINTKMAGAALTLALILILGAACGGGAGLETNPVEGDEGDYQDLDEILTSPETDLSISSGSNLPEIFTGTFRLSKIETVTMAGRVLGSYNIDAESTITVIVRQGEPFDAFEAVSNLFTEEAIEVSGLVSLDLGSNRLIIEIDTSNNDAIVEGETYCLYFGSAGGSGFVATIEGNIGGEVVNQNYVFEKIE